MWWSDVVRFFPCPFCKAGLDEVCVTASGDAKERHDSHKARWKHADAEIKHHAWDAYAEEDANSVTYRVLCALGKKIEYPYGFGVRNHDPERWGLTITEAAKYVGCNYTTAARIIRRGRRNDEVGERHGCDGKRRFYTNRKWER